LCLTFVGPQGYGLVASTTSFVENLKCELQRDPEQFIWPKFVSAIQKEEELTTIFGEFFKKGEVAVDGHFTSSYSFFYTSK